MDNPLVSVLIPIYGVEKYIERCARSVFNQTYTNIEYIFVDDCTKDNSVSILQSVINDFPNRRDDIKIIHHKQNKGLASARNTAVYSSKGKFLMHVDSDDYLLVNTAVEETVNAAIYYQSDFVIFDRVDEYEGNQILFKQTIPISHNDYLIKVLCKDLPASIWGQLILASLYKDNDIEAYEGLNSGEDYSVKPRLLYYSKKHIYLNRTFYAYTHENENAYTYRFNIKIYRSLNVIFDKLYDFFSNADNSNKWLSCINYAKTNIKANYLHRWAIQGVEANDYYEIIRTKHSWITWLSINFKYKITLILSLFVSPSFFKIYHNLFSKVKHENKII